MSTIPDVLADLRYAVQYRRKDGGHWRTMAAFDYDSVAERYAEECAHGGDRPWEYRVVPLFGTADSEER